MNSTFLQDDNGNQSSKRLVFLSSAGVFLVVILCNLFFKFTITNELLTSLFSLIGLTGGAAVYEKLQAKKIDQNCDAEKK